MRPEKSCQERDSQPASWNCDSLIGIFQRAPSYVLQKVEDLSADRGSGLHGRMLVCRPVVQLDQA